MDQASRFLEWLLAAVPSLVTVAAAILVLSLVRWMLNRRESRRPGKRIWHQIIIFVVALSGLIAVILVLPIGDARRGQLLSLLGILLSAAIALSSTTLLGNAIAGFLQRSIRNFRSGDFVRAGEHFGRVSERGLFHVEIQTEKRELTTLPNLYLINHPITVIRSSGTIVSADLSLGYDVPRGQVSELLLEAAAEAKLQDPYVRVMELGDFSVHYRVSGMLTEVKRLLTTRSRLREKILDCLHGAEIEIVSPTFMNTRALDPRAPVLSPAEEAPLRATLVEPRTSADRVFDKAEKAESLERLEERHEQLVQEIAELREQAGEPRDELERLERRRDALAQTLASMREQEPPA